MYNKLLNFCLVAFLSMFFLAEFTLAVGGENNYTRMSKLPASFFLAKTNGSSTARVTGTGSGVNLKFTNPYNDKATTFFAGYIKGTVNSVQSKFYCIDLAHTLVYYTSEQPHEYTDSGTTASAITYILNNYFPLKPLPYTNSLALDKEAASIQFAIWHFSDGVDPETIVDNIEVKNRVKQIILDATTNAGTIIPVATLSINPLSQLNLVGVDAKFKIKALDLNGNPVANVTVTLETTDGVLSAGSVITNSLGESPEITLVKGTTLNSIITAKAFTTIPQGTRYIHKIKSDEYQKVVLATPISTIREIIAKANWYIQDPNCSLLGLKTFTQGGWGSPSNSTPGKIRDQYFSLVFPSGLTVGSTFKAIFSSAFSVKNFLPGGGTAGAFTQNYNNPSGTSAGVLCGQLVALSLNVYYDAAGYLTNNPTKLKDLFIAVGPFKGKTVMEFLTIANKAIGGEYVPFSFDEINDCATSLNENYDNGTTNNGFLTCGEEERNVESWDGIIQPDLPLCQYPAGVIPTEASVTMEPDNAKGRILMFWKVIAPSTADTSTNWAYKNIFSDTSFTINASWPGVKPEDAEVRVRVGFYVQTQDGITIGNPLYREIYWNRQVCDPPQKEEADLSIEKTVSKTEIKNGETVVYTITVRNNGPKAAGDIEVIDLLPTETEFVSALASQGSFSDSTGKWIVGILNSGAYATLSITTKINVKSVESTFNLGVASEYNLFVLYDLSQPSSDTEGKVAVGRNASLAQYSVGDKLPPSGGMQDVLVVGNNLTFTTGAVFGGNVVYGNSSNLPVYSVSVVDGLVRKDSIIDFDAARLYLQNLSTSLGAYVVNGTYKFEWNEVSLFGNNPYLNVFNVPSVDLSKANNFVVNVPNGSVVLVNVLGEEVSWMGGLVLNGTNKSNILYNFPNATKMKIYGIDLLGSVLAPFAEVNFSAGVQNGQMIAGFLTGQGQFNNTRFIGNIPKDTVITNVAEISKSNMPDPDSKPGNGIATEDDYSVVSVNVSSKTLEENVLDTKWEIAGTFGEGQIVLCLANDSENNVYAGTVGGKIYKSTDNGSSWIIINEGMPTAFIWDLYIKDSKIYAATDKGIFTSVTNSPFSIAALAGKDVRSIEFDKVGNLYAGVWGLGVFKSENNGLSWQDVNNGLSSFAVHALAVNNLNEIFAGTFDLGLYKSIDGGLNWTNTSIGSSHIWSLGITSNNTIFAGTYGNGLFVSQDNGSTWMKDTSLPANFIYSIVVDDSDNVFISNWTGGIYALSPNNNNWYVIGMPDSKVSSVLLNPATNSIFAGTENGTLYKVKNLLTSVKSNQDVLPDHFELMQNYPNPFNPSTTIEFAIPQTGIYSMKIYDILGREVVTLMNKELKAGIHQITFDARALSSGIYFYQLQGQNVNITKKMVFTK